jgi:hypothetical protein
MRWFLWNALGFLSVFSPPFLLFFAWIQFLHADKMTSHLNWRRILGWLSITSASGLFLVTLTVLFTQNCHIDQGDWSCVSRWESFTRVVIRTSPVLLLLGVLGYRKNSSVGGPVHPGDCV